jgi:hypothetical protein
MPTIHIFEDPTTPAKPSTSSKVYSYPHVEDYIEIIAGHKDPNGKNKHSIFQLPESAINLARYDVKVMESFAEQCHNGIAFTDRQAKLATELVIKYERQLFKLGVDITPVKNRAEFRIPLRVIDRTSRTWVENDTINLKFPYIADVIETIRTEAKTSKGSIRWQHNLKYWSADLTEHNVNWVYTFAQQHNFEIDSSLTKLMDLLLATEKESYKIELCATADALNITNAPSTLTEYVEEHLGGLNSDNLLTLVDNAPILGYTIDKTIEEVVIEAYGTRFWSLCANRELKVDSLTNNNLIKDVADYARATNRFPIFVYEPDLSGRLKTEFNKFFPGAIMTLDNKVMDSGITDEVKVVYTTKIPRTPIERIPLMISSAGMMYGGDRQMWIQTAEKVVYFTKDVYNKQKLGHKGATITVL